MSDFEIYLPAIQFGDFFLQPFKHRIEEEHPLSYTIFNVIAYASVFTGKFHLQEDMNIFELVNVMWFSNRTRIVRFANKETKYPTMLHLETLAPASLTNSAQFRKTHSSFKYYFQNKKKLTLLSPSVNS